MTDWYKIKRILTWVNWEEKQIYPAGWKPNANTVAWWKLEWDFKDYSWNNRDLTNSWVTFTLWWPSQVAVFTNSSTYAYYENNSLFNISYPYTFNTWVKASSIGSYEYVFMWVQNWTDVSTHDKEVWFKNYNYVYSYVWSWSVSKIVSSTTVSTNTWYNVIYTYDWSNQKLYINWNLVWTLSTSSSHTWYSSARLTLSKNASTSSNVYPFSWNLSHVIVENKAWSWDDALLYYNLTKSNYGL